MTNFAEGARFICPLNPGEEELDTYEFARGLARIIDRNSEMGLGRVVESQKTSLQKISDPYRPFKTLMHLIVDIARPEDVPGLMPKGPVTVREAARILTDMASRSHVDIKGAPVVIDREMHLFLFKAIFRHFLHLLTIDRYMEHAVKHEEGEVSDVPEVRFVDEGIFFNAAAHRRWTAIIGQPSHFQAVADFLRTVGPEEYGVWYFRVMQAVVRFKNDPNEDELRLLLGQLRKPRIVN